MRVVDLRKELKSKGQETKGLKRDLQKRLLEAYTVLEQPPTLSPPAETAAVSAATKWEPTVATFNDSKSSENSVEDPVSRQSSNKTQDLDPVEDAEVSKMKPESSGESPVQEEIAKSPNSETNANDKKGGTDCIKSSSIAMKIEPAQDTNESSSKKEALDVSSTDSAKRSSMMDCDEEMSKDNLKPSFQKQSTPSKQGQDTSNVNNFEPEAYRKISQESLPTANVCVTSESASTTQMPILSSVDHNEKVEIEVPGNDGPSENFLSQRQTEKQSPIKKRVQSAIQMFTVASTSKSPVKSKSTTTPSKLGWLIKQRTQVPMQPKEHPESRAETQPSHRSSSSLHKSQEKTDPIVSKHDSTSIKEQVHQKAEKLAATARRPGMGLSSSATTASAVASGGVKPNRFLNSNTSGSSSALSSAAKASNEARKARLAEMRGKVRVMLSFFFCYVYDVCILLMLLPPFIFNRVKQ